MFCGRAEPVPTQEETTVTKSDRCDRYDVRQGLDWAIFFVSEPSGVLTIYSAYGEWGHAWPCHGDPSFKHFLVRMGSAGDDYLLRKLTKGRQKHFNLEGTVERVKGYLARHGGFSAEGLAGAHEA